MTSLCKQIITNNTNFLMVLDKCPESGKHSYRVISKPEPTKEIPAVCANETCKNLILHCRFRHELTNEFVCSSCYSYFQKHNKDRQCNRERKKNNMSSRKLRRHELVISENSAFSAPQSKLQSSPDSNKEKKKMKNLLTIGELLDSNLNF